MKKLAYTLAEITVTLAIIGVVGALTIPIVMADIRQSEYRSSYKKALKAVNDAIAINVAQDEQSPLDINSTDFNNKNSLPQYITRRMSVVKTMNLSNNATFYTSDGFSFSFNSAETSLKLHENNITTTTKTRVVPNTSVSTTSPIIMCGSYGLVLNPRNTEYPPCVVTVDVNGDRKPNPTYTYAADGKTATSRTNSVHKDTRRLSDVFNILITETGAIPYGVAAQKAIFEEEDQ